MDTSTNMADGLKTHPYGGGHDAGSEASSTCSHRNQSFNSDTADGLKPIRTAGVMMLGVKRAVLAPTATDLRF